MTIKMYGADWCGDCRRAKNFFAENDVEYTYVNLEQHPDAADIVLKRNNGLKRIPVIVFDDDTHLTEPSNEALASKLAEQATPEDQAIPSPIFNVVENREAGRFELHRDAEVVSFATYRERSGGVIVPHVETLAEHRGQGYADRLMAGILDIIASGNRTITPLCPFAAAYIRDNKQHHGLLTPRN